MKALEIAADGHPMDTCGPWAEEKFRLVSCYANIFTASMKGKWDQLTYLDLFAASGLARIKKTERVVENCAMAALKAKVPFDRYIFCDADERKLTALKARAADLGKVNTCTFIEGDTNQNVRDILAALPEIKPGTSSLTFCLVDPYKFRDLKFETIRQLATRYVDFLVFIPSYMEAHRFKDFDLSDRLNGFFGNDQWPQRWESEKSKGDKFGNFVVKEFGHVMQHELKYIFHDQDQSVAIRLDHNNRPLYHLAFFSRKALGVQFFKECKKLLKEQLALEF